MPCWCTVSSITKGTRRSRASFGSLSHQPKMGRPRPSRTTQVRWPEKHNSLHFQPSSHVGPRCCALETSLSLVCFRMLPVGKDDDSFSSPSALSRATVMFCLSIIGPSKVCQVPVLPVYLSITRVPLPMRLTPCAPWFVLAFHGAISAPPVSAPFLVLCFSLLCLAIA